MKLKFLLLMLAFLFAGCETIYTSNEKIKAEKSDITLSQDDLWSLMIGSWYGSQPTKDGGVRQQITKKLSNGVYVNSFRKHDSDGTFQDSTETGLWGASGPIYFSIFRGWVENNVISPSDPEDPYNYDSYEIIEINNEIFKYKSYSSGNIYTLKRVDDKFKLPKI